MPYDTATNSFRAAKPKAGTLPLRKDRKQLPGGFSRAMKPGRAGQPPTLPQASNRPKGQKRPTNVQPMLPPE